MLFLYFLFFFESPCILDLHLLPAPALAIGLSCIGLCLTASLGIALLLIGFQELDGVPSTALLPIEMISRAWICYVDTLSAFKLRSESLLVTGLATYCESDARNLESPRSETMIMAFISSLCESGVERATEPATYCESGVSNSSALEFVG